VECGISRLKATAGVATGFDKLAVRYEATCRSRHQWMAVTDFDTGTNRPA
jgi:hypothetical protein